MDKKSFLRAALVSAALVPAIAAAQPAVSRESVRVSYEDLDLRTAAGRTTLDGRLKLAVRKVCGALPDRHSLDQGQRWAKCLRQSRSEVGRQRQLAIRADQGEVFAGR